jgi:hypothetical protein
VAVQIFKDGGHKPWSHKIHDARSVMMLSHFSGDDLTERAEYEEDDKDITDSIQCMDCLNCLRGLLERRIQCNEKILVSVAQPGAATRGLGWSARSFHGVSLTNAKHSFEPCAK